MTIKSVKEAIQANEVTPEMGQFLVAWVERLGGFAEYMQPRNGWLLPDDFDIMMQEYYSVKGE